MGFRCGIVGLPNAGKSTLFNALARSAVAAESYPFCTIEPNVGVVPVPDPRLEALAAIVLPERVVPASLTFVDVAGLVAGASRGEGLGNRFLGHIREVDAIAHVVRCFEAEGVTHVAGRVDPAADIETVDTELMLADLDTVERALTRAEKSAKAGGREARERASIVREVGRHLGEGRPARTLELADPARGVLRELSLLTAKPVMFVANVGEDDGFEDNPRLEAVRAAAAAEDARVLPICAAIESELAGLDPEDQGEFLADLGLEAPGLDRFVAGRLRAPRPSHVLLRGRQGGAGVDGARRRHRPRGSGPDPHRLRARLHPRRGRDLRRFPHARRRAGRAGGGPLAPGGPRLHHHRRRRNPLPLQRLTRPPQQYESLRVGVRTRRDHASSVDRDRLLRHILEPGRSLSGRPRSTARVVLPPRADPGSALSRAVDRQNAVSGCAFRYPIATLAKLGRAPLRSVSR